MEDGSGIADKHKTDGAGEWFKHKVTVIIMGFRDGRKSIRNRRLFVRHSSNLNSTSCTNTIGQEKALGEKLVHWPTSTQWERIGHPFELNWFQGPQPLTHPSCAYTITYTHTHVHSFTYVILLQISEAQHEILHSQNHYSLNVEFIPGPNWSKNISGK